MYRINSSGSLSPENRGKGLGRGLPEFLRKCRKEGGVTVRLSLNLPTCRHYERASTRRNDSCQNEYDCYYSRALPVGKGFPQSIRVFGAEGGTGVRL